MAGTHSLSLRHLQSVIQGRSIEELVEQLQPHTDDLPRRIPATAKVTSERAETLWGRLPENEADRNALLGPDDRAILPAYAGHIENCIGTVKVPVGAAGPLRVNGLHAKGDYVVPLATTEAALVASYHRGACLLSEAGGASAAVVNESVSRGPAFAFTSLAVAGQFLIWLLTQFERLQEVASSTTNHGSLLDFSTTVEGNHIYLTFEFQTGDASGQNMVTIATQAICEYILENTPVQPSHWYVEGNMSGDKKASARAFTSTRGKKVTAEATISRALIEKYLHTTPELLCRYWRMSAVGGVLSGTMGVQGHYANGLAAIYLATGQDVACVAESAIGVTRFERTEDGDLYATVTLPGIMVGTVGGGTGLPSQKAALDLMGLAGTGKARALAEVIAATLLGGELSIIGALTAGDFTSAHKKLARGKIS
jgi:hydroxymethylglutaryl-CoA reductase (NADPH)